MESCSSCLGLRVPWTDKQLPCSNVPVTQLESLDHLLENFKRQELCLFIYITGNLCSDETSGTNSICKQRNPDALVEVKLVD